jgi:hypothetical protein
MIMQTTFVKIVQNHFSFLIRDFGFSLSSATESPRGDQWEGDVQYTTNTALINLNCTRGEQPSLWIGRVQDKKGHLLPIQVIYEYMSLSSEEKKIVLSPSEGRQAAILLNKKQLSHLIRLPDNLEEKMNLQLENYARYLREYAIAFLKGDFSQWLAIWEYQVEKLTVEHTRVGRQEFVPIVANDENGHLRVIGKQHIFKESLDYIRQLKSERGADK